MELKVILALLLVVIIVLGINGFLILTLRGKKNTDTIQMFQKAAKRIRNPWQTEDENLEKLSHLVANLKEQTSTSPQKEDKTLDQK